MLTLELVLRLGSELPETLLQIPKMKLALALRLMLKSVLRSVLPLVCLLAPALLAFGLGSELGLGSKSGLTLMFRLMWVCRLASVLLAFGSASALGYRLVFGLVFESAWVLVFRLVCPLAPASLAFGWAPMWQLTLAMSMAEGVETWRRIPKRSLA